MLSARAVKDTEQALEKAKEALRDLLKSREWDTREEADALHSMLQEVERANVNFYKFECLVYGFETWRYLTEDAINAETWRELEATKKAKRQ